MRMGKRWGLLAIARFALALAVPLSPAWADAPPPPAAQTPALDLDAVAKRLQNYFTEEELGTLFDYMRDVSIASLRGAGDEVLMPPDLAFKMAILQERMLREGEYQMQLMMKQLERDIDRALKDLFIMVVPPPPAPTPKQAPPPAPAPEQRVQPSPAPATGPAQRTSNPYLQP